MIFLVFFGTVFYNEVGKIMSERRDPMKRTRKILWRMVLSAVLLTSAGTYYAAEQLLELQSRKLGKA